MGFPSVPAAIDGIPNYLPVIIHDQADEDDADFVLNGHELAVVYSGFFTDAVMERDFDTDGGETELWFIIKKLRLDAFLVNDSVVVWSDSILCASQLAICTDRTTDVSV